jgi:hypothetical protein
MNTDLILFNINQNYIGHNVAQGIAKCFQAYADNCPAADIMECGLNRNTGFVYIALENGIQIASAFGQDCVFFVTDFDNGSEHEFDSYQEAVDFNHPMSH